MTPKQNALDSDDCPSCGVSGRGNWDRAVDLPQIGTVYECENCGQHCHLYDATEPPARDESFVLHPVTQHMRINLQFAELADGWPDDVLTDLYERGLERQEAIDYHAVEREGLSQSEWARRTNRSQSTVSEAVRDAKVKIATDD